MDVDDFVHWWRSRDRHDLEAIATALEAQRETAEGEVGRLRAVRDISVLLRRAGRARLGCEAAHRASVAAMSACTAAGVYDTDRRRAILLSRAAGDAALGLAAGERTASIDTVLRPFFGSMVLSVS